MSLLGTLAKVAIGVAVAKGVGGMLKGGSSGGGGILGNAPQQAPTGSQGGGLGDLLGQVLGGGQQGGASGNIGGKGGLGDLLEGLSGGIGGQSSAPTGSQSGGLGDILGQLTKGTQGGAGGAGGLGDILGQLTGKAAQQQGGGGSFGDILNDALRGGGEPQAQPSADQEAVAALMLSAMIQAAKCDGNLDESERQKLLSNLKDATPEEMAFVNHELESPVDVDGLVRQVPRGLEQQVYTMSVMAINLDSKNEALYLDKLAQGFGINHQQADAIHDQLGVPRLYS